MNKQEYIDIFVDEKQQMLINSIKKILQVENIQMIAKKAGARGFRLLTKEEYGLCGNTALIVTDQHPALVEMRKIDYRNMDAMTAVIITEAVTAYVIRNGS